MPIINVVHTKSATHRLLAALHRLTFGEQRQGLSYLKKWLRFPIEHSAALRIASVADVTVLDLFPGREIPTTIPLPVLERHAWNVKLDEKILIGLVAHLLGP